MTVSYAHARSYRVIAVIIAVTSLGLFALSFTAPPAYDTLSVVRGSVSHVSKPRRAKAKLFVTIDGSTRQLVSMEYSSSAAAGARRIKTGMPLEIRGEHDVLGRDIFFAWEVRSGADILVSYDDFVARHSGGHAVTRMIAGAALALAGVLFGAALWIERKHRNMFRVE